MSQNNHLVRGWVPDSFIEQTGGGEEVKYKGNNILQVSPGMSILGEGVC